MAVGAVTVDLLAELEQRCNGDDWTQDPWFLRPEQQAQLRSFDFSPGDLVAARDALAIVYPPAVCRTLLGLPSTPGGPVPTGPVEAPPEAGFMADLFWQVWPHWIPLLGLGVDPALARPWHTAVLCSREGASRFLAGRRIASCPETRTGAT
jgi:hypothetical protein